MRLWPILYTLLVLVTARGAITDTCEYRLRIPPDLDLPSTPHFDTTIVRTAGCAKHLLWFPPQGTETRYILQHDTVTRDLHFAMQEVEKQWLDISTLPAGDHTVHLLACGNGGSFTLRIE